ncbi:MAG: hypothetical protein ACTS80_00750 [Candidatus Hodgkinia cicadicola]
MSLNEMRKTTNVSGLMGKSYKTKDRGLVSMNDDLVRKLFDQFG